MTHVNATTYELRGQFDKLISEKNDLCLAHRTGDRTQAWMDVYYSHPSPKQALSLGKKIAKLEKQLPELYAALKPLLVRIMACATDYHIADQAEKQAKADRKAAIAAKKADKEEVKRNPYHRLHPEVAALLKQVAEPYRLKAIAMETERQTRILDEIKKLGAMYDSFAPSKMFPTKVGDTWGNQLCLTKQQVALSYVEKSGSWPQPAVWALKANAEAIVAAKAKTFADDLVTAFIHKVGTKLSGIIEKKIVAKTSISGSLQDHWMHFEFTDGSRFQVQSQIVWKTSVNGVHFAQYPTCFRRVKLSSGQAMDTPSESKMKEQFV